MLATLELSEYQKTFWYLYHTEGDSPFYHVGAIYQLSGQVDRAWFEEILHQIIAQNESLSTAYEMDEMGQVQVKKMETPFSLSYIDCSVFLESERREKASNLAVREFNRPFALEKGDLIHSTLIKVSDIESIWIVSISHIIADLFSYNIFIQQFKDLYEAKFYSRKPPIPRKISLEDIHKHERELLSQGHLLECKKYWKDALEPLPEPLSFPSDVSIIGEESLVGDHSGFNLEEKISVDLYELSKKLGVSLFTLLTSSVAVFIRHFSKDGNFLLGYESTNRMTTESRSWVWPRVNQLCVKIQSEDGIAFDKFAKQVQAKLSLSFKYQDYPFYLLPGLLNLDREKQSSGFLPVKVLMEPPVSKLELSGLEINEIPIPNYHSPFPLVFRFANNAKTIRGEISFQKQLFTRETVEKWKEAWIASLDQILSQPDINLVKLNETISRTMDIPSIDATKKIQFKRKALSTVGLESVQIQRADPYWDFPMKISPKAHGVHLDIWLKQNKDVWAPILDSHGALLFRGFDVLSPDYFERVALAVHPEKVEYVEPSQPRPEFKEKVYISTEYPSTEILHQHSELNYTYHWPLKGLLCCIIPAETGGETPLADNREILGRMDPSLLQMFVEKGVMYQRNYGEGLLVPWQKVFKTEDPKKVEEYCEENAPMTYEWKLDGGLRTRQIRPSIITHPRTHEKVWFNQFHLFHAGSLGKDRFDELLKTFDEDSLPAHAYFGDGTPITFEQLEHVYDVMRKSCVSIPWEKGDVIVVDNVLISHGRNPFTGDRKVLACFVEPHAK